MSRMHLGASVGLALLAVSCTPPPAAEPAPAPARARAAEPVVVRHWTHTTLARGQTLAQAMARAKIPPSEAVLYIEALSAKVDLRSLPAGTGLALARDAEGRLKALALRAARTGPYLTVTQADGGALELRERPLPVSREVRRANAVVTTTVAEALGREPFGTELTLAFSEIVQWDMDLFVDPRPGDTLRLVYEVLRLRAVPEDLPPFRTTPLSPGAPLGLGRILAASYLGAMARVEAYWAEDGHGGGYYDPWGRALRKTFLRSPLNYRRISSRFSHRRRHPITRQVVPHHGVDFAAAAGTPVVAAADGRVHAVGWRGALGRAVELRHGGGYRTIYGHLSRVARGIRPGARVRQNQVIGYVGATGRATGPHLHYTVLFRGRPVDPLRMKNPAVAALEPAYWFELARAQHRWGPWLARGTPAASGSAEAVLSP